MIGALKLFETYLNLYACWIKFKTSYLNITTKALRALYPFPTPYLDEASFFYGKNNQSNIIE